MPMVELPPYSAYLLPVLRAIDHAHGSANKREIDEAVVELMALTPEQLSVVYPEGSTAKGSKVLHRIAFGRTSLKLIGALDNPVRGIWTMTAIGRTLLAEGADAVRQADWEMRKQLAAKRNERAASDQEGAPVDSADLDSDDSADLGGSESADVNWREEVLDRIHALDPSAFERLCALLLRRAGCRSVEVTQRSGDEGLDGIGVLEISLLSFPVFFQAKNHRRAIPPAVVRELRGAMAGRGDKGILITSGAFSKGAREESQRAGTPPIDLIDGQRLCDLLLEYKLGVEELPIINPQFFDNL